MDAVSSWLKTRMLVVDPVVAPAPGHLHDPVLAHVPTVALDPVLALGN